MMLVEETAVPQAALPVTAFKDHLRLGSGFAEDSLQDPVLEAYLRAAIAAVEARTGKILIERSFTWTVTAWRDPGAHDLPTAPISAIESVVLQDGQGAQTTIPLSSLRLLPDSQTPRLVALAGCLPTIPTAGLVKVRFLAGYGPDWLDLPADMAQAVLMLAAHFYEFRHDGEGDVIPGRVAALIDRYRMMRLSLGRGRA